ncbi:MAG: hypothetical protein RLZZ301_704 [Bacteroidota bacterium]
MSQPSPKMAFIDQVASHLGHAFTPDQLEALTTFVDFFHDQAPRKLWILKGYAGTGKSSLMAALVKTLRSERVAFRLLAPTGRAAKVVSNYAAYTASTIHKQIYFSGNELLNQRLSTAKNLCKNTLFFVDEASMISNESDYEGPNLLEDLLNYVYSGDNCHLIFIGDPGQLPPVGQEQSIALHPEALRIQYPSLHLFLSQLQQVVRVDSSSVLLQNATAIRQLQHYQLPLFTAVDQQQVRRIQGNDFQECLESSYAQVGLDETILLTLSNKRANQWNLEIRNRLFYREEVLEKGDIVMVVKNNYTWLDPSSKMGFIANGELARIDKVRKLEQLYGLLFAHVDLRFVDYPELEPLTCIVHTASLQEEAANLKRETLKHLFYAIEAEHADIRNKQKRYQQVLKSPYFNALQLKYAHAVTVHKAQGGQWAHVYIDYGFVPDELKNEGYLRWIYTAVTRATTQLTLVNFPAAFFAET